MMVVVVVVEVDVLGDGQLRLRSFRRKLDAAPFSLT